MNFISLFYFLSLFSVVSATVSGSILHNLFEEWAAKYNYDVYSGNKYLDLFSKWVSNHKFIEETNAKNLTYTLGHNQFSAMDLNDFRTYLGYNIFDMQENKSLFENDKQFLRGNLPSSVNWVEVGGVTHVKDQGQCGSCWSFSTTGALEGAYFVKYGVLFSFSEQQLVSCDNYRNIANRGTDHGCSGGLMDNAFKWIENNDGLCTENDYPYVSGNGVVPTCISTCDEVKGSGIVNFYDVKPSDDTAMMTAISKQPVSIAIEADQREFQLYKSGVYTGTCGTNLDHGVLVVGYGSIDGNDYYLVKNSWSQSWGDDGYIKLGRGASYNKGDGQCGVLLQGSYPVL
jgi:C1A family cysteine protease